MDFEAILRLFIAPLGTKDDIIGTLRQVHADTQEMLQFAGEVKHEFIDGINPTQDQVYLRVLPVDTPGEALKDISVPPKSQTRARS